MPDELEFEPSESSASAPDLTTEDFSTGGVSDEAPAPAAQPSQQQAAPAQPAAVQPLSIRDAIGQLGYQLPAGIQDDYVALTYLARQAQQAQQLAAAQREQDVFTQLGRQLAPQAQQVSQYLQQQQQPAGPKPWEPPPFDERWIPLVQKNEATGLYVANAGVNPDIAAAVNKYVDWQAKFMRDPAATLAPLLDDYKRQAVEAARAEIQQSLAQTQTQASVQRIVAENSRWFYAKDGSGAVVTDPITRQAQPSPVGVQYLSVARALRERGMADPVHIDEVARAILAPQIQAALGVQDVDQAAQQRQAQAGRARPNRNPLQALAAHQGANTPGYTPPDQQGLSFSDRLRRSFVAQGVTDADIANSVGV